MLNVNDIGLTLCRKRSTISRRLLGGPGYKRKSYKGETLTWERREEKNGLYPGPPIRHRLIIERLRYFYIRILLALHNLGTEKHQLRMEKLHSRRRK